ncbi:MAG: SpoIID/LytB domain-containing protein [Oscillospiraceae bacterium]|nr:SpoIID/LytB domain-containing protein [Oscillospiraceae bacterium]
MKNFIGIFIFLLTINLFVPVIYCRVYSRMPGYEFIAPESVPAEETGQTVTLMDRQSGKMMEIPLKDYLIGAAACEMPALYEKEAIKAQMVAVHSYYLYCRENPEHLKNGYIEINEDKMSGYASPARLMEYWQMDYYDYYNKFASCADEVMDKILTYDGKPALTSYYAVSCGKTADSKDVWGQSLPYLISVDSSHDQISDNYLQVKKIDKDSMFSLLRINYPNIKLEEDRPKSWFGDIIYTDSGYAGFVTVGSDLVPADQIRNVLGLPSTCLMIFYEDETFSIATKGYGHGVGLSQFGANQLSQQGKKYDEILEYYYPGTKIEAL